MRRRLAFISAAIAALSANSYAFDMGVNIHLGGGSTAANDQIATVMKQRNLKTARFDHIENTALLRDQIAKIKANGGYAEAVTLPSFHWDNSCNPNLAAIETRAYNDATVLVNGMKDLVQTFELMNEVRIRPEINAEVPWNTYGQDSTVYANKPCVASLVAALKGMSRAIRDIRAADGSNLKIILGHLGRDFGFTSYLIQQGVVFDILGYHHYPHSPQLLLSDTWYGPGGLGAQLAKYNKPIHLNEFNCGETYNSNYDNVAGSATTETCLKSIDKHLTELKGQTQLNLETVHLYELVDEPQKSGSEAKFGMMYNLSQPKVQLYLASAFAGGNLTAFEQGEITRRGLLTDAEIAAFKAAAPAPAPAPATESPDGATISSGSTAVIVDDYGAKWTVSGGVIYRDGIATISSSVTLVLYYGHAVYQQNSFGGWWKWNNTILTGNPWVATTDPRVAPAPAPADAQVPVVSITSPANGSVFSPKSTITATATASDNVGVKEVRFNLEGTLRCVIPSAPYTCQITLPGKSNAQYTLEAQAIDPAGNIGRSSTRISTTR